MSIPTRQVAARMLLDLEPPAWLLRHSAAVAEVAADIAQRAVARGAVVDPALAEAAALLHDIDKLPPAAELASVLGHGRAGAAWLAAHGLAELGPAVANHPATRLSDPQEAAAWLAGASAEELIVAYADKRATQHLVTLDDRFDEWLERHPDHAPAIERGRASARLLEARVCELAGITPAQVTRLAWVEQEVRASRQGRTT